MRFRDKIDRMGRGKTGKHSSQLNPEMSVVTSTAFSASNLSVSEPKLVGKSKQAYLNYERRPLLLQGPQLRIPFNASDYEGDGRFKVQFSLDESKTNPRVAKFQDVITAIDNYVLDQAVKNQTAWFNKTGKSRETLEDSFKYTVRVSKDKTSGAERRQISLALKRKAPKEGSTEPGPFLTELFDESKRLIEGQTPVQVLRRNTEIVPILRCGGIWIVDGKFGVTWTLSQASVKVRGESGSSGTFAGVDEDEDTNLVTAADEDLMAAVLPSKAAAAAASDDESEPESEEDDEDHTEKAPPVPVAKPSKAAPVAAKPVAVAKPSKVPKAGK